MRIGVFGTGAIGGILGGFCHIAGHDVLLIDKADEHVDAINQNGLLITGIKGEFRVLAGAVTPEQMGGHFDLIFLCVKSQDTVESMKVMLPHLNNNSYVVSMQNGLNEEIIAEFIGRDKTVGCLVDWGADYEGPGHIQYGGEGPMRLGMLDGNTGKEITDIQAILNHTAPTYISENILGYLWSKLIWGGFFVGNALGNASCVEMLSDRANSYILKALFREGTLVAQRAGIKLEALTEHDFDPIELLDSKDVYAAFAKMADSFRGHLKTHSGPWRDIAIRRRPTEADFIIGVIVSRGEALGMETPLNSRLLSMIKEVERGERKQNDSNLLELGSLM